jgi:hypothetical protein
MEVLVKMSILTSDDVIPERKTKVLYEGQQLMTIPELSKAMDISQSRLRGLLAEEAAPPPVYEGERYYRGRIKSLYDLKEVIKYFLKTKKQVISKQMYILKYAKLGYVNADEIQM